MPTVTSNGTVVVRRNPLDWITGALTVIGAINWGLVGLAHFGLVAANFGAGSAGARIVYILVSLAGVYLLIRAFVPNRSHALANH
jgi:uncharacterized membrane protein YuzA (DUF378 family)